RLQARVVPAAGEAGADLVAFQLHVLVIAPGAMEIYPLQERRRVVDAALELQPVLAQVDAYVGLVRLVSVSFFLALAVIVIVVVVVVVVVVIIVRVGVDVRARGNAVLAAVGARGDTQVAGFAEPGQSEACGTGLHCAVGEVAGRRVVAGPVFAFGMRGMGLAGDAVVVGVADRKSVV